MRRLKTTTVCISYKSLLNLSDLVNDSNIKLYAQRTLDLNEYKIIVQVWETDGNNKQFAREANGVIVMTDITDENSLENSTQWK